MTYRGIKLTSHYCEISPHKNVRRNDRSCDFYLCCLLAPVVWLIIKLTLAPSYRSQSNDPLCVIGNSSDTGDSSNQ